MKAHFVTRNLLYDVNNCGEQSNNYVMIIKRLEINGVIYCKAVDNFSITYIEVGLSAMSSIHAMIPATTSRLTAPRTASAFIANC